MVHGYFQEGIDIPYVEVAIVSGRNIVHSAFVLDTGFSGDLKVDRQTAQELGLVPFEEGRIANAQGDKMYAGRAWGHAELEGRKILVGIFILDGPPLAGIGLFSAFGYKAVVDCVNRTAHLERVA